MDDVANLLHFIVERHSIYTKKAAGLPAPWTEDPVLQQYRFCNVYRNLDTQTQLIHDNWLHPHADNPDVWFAMTVARLVNWWPTLAAVKLPLPWHPERFVKAMDVRKAAGEKVFTGAYMVRADAVVEGSKAAYLAHYVLQPMWEARKALRPRAGDTLDAFHRRLMGYRDMGSFMAAQVVADVKYATAGHLAQAEDWHTWAASGPGSRRGLSRLRGYPVSTDWKESIWRAAFSDLYATITPMIAAAGLPTVTGQDLQNCLCEYDKHRRVQLNQGRPRSRYTPSTK